MRRRGRLLLLGRVLAAAFLVMLLFCKSGWPQTGNTFGAEERARAAQQMIVLGVQQGISSLPPTSGQSLTYRFDWALGTFEPSEWLEPFSFRSPQTIGSRKFSVRLALSYFELTDSLGPITYLVDGDYDPQGLYTRFGLDASAKVGLINLAGNYGISNRFEVNVNLPLVITDAQASEVFTSVAGDPNEAIVTVDSEEALNLRLASGDYVYVTKPFPDIGVPFNEGTQFGVGRISLGVKAVLLEREDFQLTFFPEFFFPSPNENEFAGSDSAAFLPRFVAALPVVHWLKFYGDVGYDFDFTEDELSRFVWNVGAAIPLRGLTIDFGFGGSEFAEGIEWTPAYSTFVGPRGESGTLQALADNRLGTSFLDFLGGVKAHVADRWVLAGGVNVPLNDEGFRAAAVGTVAVEAYF